MKIFKLTIFAALSLALSVASYAQPTGWTQGVGNKHRSDAVAAHEDAIHRGGAFFVDTSTLQQELLPWSDGDSITLDFVLPGAITSVLETPVGWEGTISNSDLGNGSWSAGIADLDGVKGLGRLSDALDDFVHPGAQAYVRIPVGDVPGSGEWRPVQKQLGGDWEDFTFAIQAPLTAEQIANGASRKSWGDNSIAVWHKTKKNDFVGGHKYMNGKVAHLPPPVAVGFRSNLTTVTGWTFGTWELDSITGRLTKVFDAAVIQGWNQTASVVVDATLGYTTAPGTLEVHGSTPATISWTNRDWIAVDQDYTINSVHYYHKAFNTFTCDPFYSVHRNVTPGTDNDFDYVVDSLVTMPQITEAASEGWYSGTPDAGTPALTSGWEISISYTNTGFQSHNWSYGYDTDGDYPVAGLNSGWVTLAADNADSDTSQPPANYLGTGGGLRGGAYVTVTAAGAGGADAGPLNLGLGIGL